MPCIFISYKTEDTAVAHRVNERVKLNPGFTTYFDKIDDADIADGPNLAEHLRKRISECDQLMAIVSHNTAESWWVPWEIGVGFEREFKMASYIEESAVKLIESLPSYLKIWPRLQSMTDVDTYCRNSKMKFYDMSPKGDMTRLVESTNLQEIAKIPKRIQSAYFHEKLKQDLGQA